MAAKLNKLPASIATDFQVTRHGVDRLVDVAGEIFLITERTFERAVMPWIRKRNDERIVESRERDAAREAAAKAPPPFCHFTCGTGYLSAQATLALIEQMLGTTTQAHIDHELVDRIEHLVDRSGVDWAAAIAKRHWDRHGDHLIDEVPF